jgi:hypothetical protein
MYQMSQALAAGVIHLQDWNSLSNANMAWPEHPGSPEGDRQDDG